MWGQEKVNRVIVCWPGTGNWGQGLMSTTTAHQRMSRDWGYTSLCLRKGHTVTLHTLHWGLDRLQIKYVPVGSKTPPNGIKSFSMCFYFLKQHRQGLQSHDFREKQMERNLINFHVIYFSSRKYPKHHDVKSSFPGTLEGNDKGALDVLM